MEALKIRISSGSDGRHGSRLTQSSGLPVRARRAPGYRAVRGRVRGLKASLRAVALAPVYALYTRRLRVLVGASQPPHHVAVILDGNRRWASLAGMREPGAGHRRGADKLFELIGWCSGLGIGELTVWALSIENLSRAEEEVAALTEILSEELGVSPSAQRRWEQRSGSASSGGSMPSRRPLPRRHAESRRRLGAMTVCASTSRSATAAVTSSWTRCGALSGYSSIRACPPGSWRSMSTQRRSGAICTRPTTPIRT